MKKKEKRVRPTIIKMMLFLKDDGFCLVFVMLIKYIAVFKGLQS